MLILGDGQYIPNGGYTGGSSGGLTQVSPYEQSGLYYPSGGYIPPSTAGGYDSNTTQLNTGYSGGSGSSSGSSSPSYDPNDLAYLNTQLGRYQGLLGDVDTFQRQATDKLTDSYNSAVNKAKTTHGRAVEDYNTKQYEDERGKERSIGKVDDNAYNLNRSLRMILGLAGGSGSSAFKYAAPDAVAKAASGERGGVLSDYSDNVNRLKTARKRTTDDYNSLLTELEDSKNDKMTELSTGYDLQRQGLNDTLAQIAAEISSLTKGNPLDATAPYRTAYDSLQNQIKGYGDQYRTAVDQRELSVAPVSLKDYVVDRQALNANKQFGQANSSPYAQFLNRQRDEDERVI